MWHFEGHEAVVAAVGGPVRANRLESCARADAELITQGCTSMTRVEQESSMIDVSTPDKHSEEPDIYYNKS